MRPELHGGQQGMEGAHDSAFRSVPSTPYLLLLAGPLLFSIIAFSQLSLVEEGLVLPGRFVPVGVLGLCVWGGAWALHRWLPAHDRLLLPLVGIPAGTINLP